MGIRRRRKQLTTLLYNMDRRVRSVELKKVIYKTGAASTDAADDTASNTPADPGGTLYAPTSVNPWKRIYKAYYHGYNQTGQGSDRVDLWFDGVDLDAEAGEGISVSNLYFEAKPTRIDRTYIATPDEPSYAIRAHGTPEWSTSATNTRDDYVQPGGYLVALDSTVDHTYLISHGSKTSFTAPSQPLIYRQAVVKHSATTTTATITLNSGHHYRTGDIIEVNDLPSGYRGIDGIFRIASTTSTTITYDFDPDLSSSISEANAASDVYIYSVACKYRRVGSTLFDANNKVYYWNGLRYQTTAAGLTNDGSAPSPPTDLTISVTAYSMADGSQRARADLSWNAPTTSANGNPLDDLAGYRVLISETGFSDWTQKITYGIETAQTIIGLDQEKTYYFQVVAFDAFGNDSVGLNSGSGTLTGKSALSVVTPSAPIIPTPRLGVVKVSWDGKDNTNVFTPLALLKYVEVHASTSSGFTPSSSTLQGKIYSSKDSLNISDLTYNTTYYFKFLAVDKADNYTTASTQTSAVIKPIVDADMIAAELNSPLSVWPFANAVVTPGALQAGTINASNIFGANVVVQSAIAANAIGADQIAANAITAGKIEAGSITTAALCALAITADKINANAITADKIQAGAVTTDKLTAGTITGFNIQTAASGTRVILNGTNISFYNSSDIFSGSIYGSSSSWGTTMTLGAGSTIMEIGTNEIRLTADATNLLDVSGQWYTSGTLQLDSDTVTEIGSTTGPTLIFGSGGLDVNGSRVAAYGFSIFGVGSIINSSGYVFPRNPTATTGTANVRQASSGSELIRVTSARRYKLDIQDVNYGLKALELRPRTWIDKYEYDKNGESIEGLYRVPGFVAEEVLEAGLDELITYDYETGEIAGLSYDRMLGAIIPVLQNFQARLNTLENK